MPYPRMLSVISNNKMIFRRVFDDHFPKEGDCVLSIISQGEDEKIILQSQKMYRSSHEDLRKKRLYK